jgi:hypothetical protein
MKDVLKKVKLEDVLKKVKNEIFLKIGKKIEKCLKKGLT